MSRSELICNWLLGLSALGWAVRAVVSDETLSGAAAVPLTFFAVNALVGVLFLIRAPLRVPASPLLLAAAVPSFVLGGLVMHLARREAWPLYSQGLFVAGGALTFAALACLGRSFAILPGVRKIVVRGPYRIVRHPAYAGECIMLAGASIAAPGPALLAAALAALALLIVRILAEERTLLADPDYRTYAEAHPWRLMPFIW